MMKLAETPATPRSKQMKARVAWNRLVVRWGEETVFRARLRRERTGVTGTRCKGRRYWRLYPGSFGFGN